MGKLSQKELLNDGFGSLVSGLARTAGKALAGTARALAPETSAALGKGAALAAGAIQNVQSGNPTAAATEFVKSQEGRRFFKNGKVKFGKEQKLPNNDIKIPIVSGIYLVNQGGGNVEERNLEGGHIVLRRTKQPGMNGFTNNVTDVVDGQGNKLNNGILGSRKSQQAQPAAPQAQPAAEEPKAEEPAPQAEEPQQEEPTAEEPQSEEPTAEEPSPTEVDFSQTNQNVDFSQSSEAQPQPEEPTAEEPQPEEPQADEPAQEEPPKQEVTSDTLRASLLSHMGANKGIFDAGKFLSDISNGSIKPDRAGLFLQDNGINVQKLQTEPTEQQKLAKVLLDKGILKESQKNTLKHLQSLLRENKWTIGQ